MQPASFPAPQRTARHLRVLTELHQSLFAPSFQALESYGKRPSATPSAAQVLEAARAALAWHRERECVMAAELNTRRASEGNALLIDDASRLLAYHRAERERIADELRAAEALPQAAE